MIKDEFTDVMVEKNVEEDKQISLKEAKRRLILFYRWLEKQENSTEIIPYYSDYG